MIKCGLTFTLREIVVRTGGLQIPTQPDPTHPIPPLIGDGTPAALYALICSVDWPAEAPLEV